MVSDKRIKHLTEKNNTKKSNGEQSDFCDLEQVTLKPQLQAHHCLITWLQIWYHSLLWGDIIRKGANLEKQNCLFGVHPAVMGKLAPLTLSKLWRKFVSESPWDYKEKSVNKVCNCHPENKYKIEAFWFVFNSFCYKSFTNFPKSFGGGWNRKEDLI